MGHRDDQVEQTPAQIREAIAQARADLVAHLGALTDPQLSSGGDGPGDPAMTAKTKKAPDKTAKATTNPAAKRDKPEAKASTKASPKKKSSVTRTVKGAAATMGHVIDTMAAGAVAGAVKAAAVAIEENEAKALKGRRKTSPSTGDVLGEIAPNAAVGAIAGAAKAVLPDETNGAKTSKTSKTKAVGKK